MKQLLIGLFLVFSLHTQAQYFSTGQDPASLKWRQINTENFQLIYPDYFEDQAQELANKLEHVYDYGGYSLGFQPNKISVILHTQTVNSNGLVAYAPKRSEFYTTPHQSMYAQDWLEQLAIHEFRHVVQIDKVNEELPKLVKILLGEQGTALVFGAYLPWWFIEGDAVVAETALGKFGRGRFPSFLVEHRAQLVEKGKYSYDKAYLGSFKNYVPNHYMMGYHIVANSRERYGADIWESVLNRVGQKPLSLAPFNKALKQEIGMNKVKLYNSVFDSLAVAWRNDDKNFSAAPSRIISQASKTYTNYQYNHWLSSTEIISYKTALNRIPAFVKLDKNGNEKHILYPGHIFDESINYRREWVVWSERIPDLRWEHSGRSKICLLNVVSNKKLSFFPEHKAFAPSISPDYSNVVVVESDFSNNFYLSVYRISDGKLITRIQTDDNNYFFSPEWLNENELLAVVLTNDGKRLAKFNVSGGAHEILLNEEFGDIKHLRVRNNTLYFIAGITGKSALYSYSFENKKIHQLYEPRFGVAYPSFNEKGELLLSDYTADGFRIIELEKVKEKNRTELETENYPLTVNLTKQEKGILDFSKTDSTRYNSEKYSKAKNLFNFHSWAPVFVDVNNYDFSSGVSVVSQNKLGTSETVLGYRWDSAENTGKWYAGYTYKGWYPMLSFELSSGKETSNYWLITETMRNNEVIARDTTLENFSWNETVLNTRVSLPLNLSSGAYLRLLQPDVAYDLSLYKNNSSTPENFPDGIYHALAYRLYYQQFLRQSHQDVYPNFGFILEGTYKHSPNGTQGLGNLMAAQSLIYLPGFLSNHGTKAYFGAQKKERGDFLRFSDVVRFPRGWTSVETKNLYSMALNYKLPIVNPDWSLGSLVYFQRINANLFADYAHLKIDHFEQGEFIGTFDTNISSYGMELVCHVNFLRFFAPVQIGVRSSYLTEIEDMRHELLLSVDLATF